MSETWRQVPGFEFYEVSDHGRVRSLKGRHRPFGSIPIIMKPNKVGLGYHALSLWAGGVKHRRYIHHLVLLAFVGPRPAGMETCHGDGDLTNNLLSNLRWDTHSANMHDNVRLGRFTCPAPHGEAQWAAKMTVDGVREARRLHAAGRSIRGLAKQFCISKPAMQHIIHRKTWKQVA